MARYMYIVEGEIEERFMDGLKSPKLNKIIPGRIAVFNLMQQKIKPSSGLMTFRYERVFCIIDTDVLTGCELDNLKSNLEMLSEISKKQIFLLVQNKNFEDELTFMASVNNLQTLLGLKHGSLKDIKNHLAQKVDYSKLRGKVDFNKYCTRWDRFKTVLDDENIKLPKKATITDITKCK